MTTIVFETTQLTLDTLQIMEDELTKYSPQSDSIKEALNELRREISFRRNTQAHHRAQQAT